MDHEAVDLVLDLRGAFRIRLDDDDVLALERQPLCEIGADGSGSDHDDSHG